MSHKKPISQLLEERQSVMHDLGPAATHYMGLMNRLAEIDKELLPRFEAFAVAMGDVEPPPKPTAESTKMRFAGGGLGSMLTGASFMGNDVVNVEDLIGEPPLQQLPFASLMPRVMNIMAQYGGPMKPSMILRELAKDGVTLVGKVPSNNLSAHMSNYDDVFQNVGPEGWQLTMHAYADVHSKLKSPTGQSGASQG